MQDLFEYLFKVGQRCPVLPQLYTGLDAIEIGDLCLKVKVTVTQYQFFFIVNLEIIIML